MDHVIDVGACTGTKFKAPGPTERELRLAKKKKRANEAAMNKKRKKVRYFHLFLRSVWKCVRYCLE